MHYRSLAVPAVVIAAVAAALGLAVVASLAVGAREIPPGEVWNALFAFDPSNADHAIVRDLRVDRTLIGIVAGALLAVAGALTQTATRNPLADPGLLGINAGAALAVVLGVSLWGATGFAPQLWLAFAGAGAAGLAAYAIGARGTGASAPVRLVLAGAAITALLGSVTSAIVLAQPFVLNEFRFWLAGSLVGRAGVPVLTLAAVAAVTLAASALLIRPLQALALGEDAAAALGVNSVRTRGAVLLAVTVMAGIATAVAGPIAFVGLAVPHLVRAVAGASIGWLVALSAPVGAALVLACDVVGRIVARPGEVSVGITTALLGGALLAFYARRLKAVTL